MFTIDPGLFVSRGQRLHLDDTVLVPQQGVEGLNLFSHELIRT